MHVRASVVKRHVIEVVVYYARRVSLVGMVFGTNIAIREIALPRHSDPKVDAGVVLVKQGFPVTYIADHSAVSCPRQSPRVSVLVVE